MNINEVIGILGDMTINTPLGLAKFIGFAVG
jgi:hypothetical protein